MARYNPNNKQHRKSLAKRIAKMLGASGFSRGGSSTGEDVFTRPVDGVTTGSAEVRVLTSIFNGEMRRKDKDAIRVCATYTNSAGQTRGLGKTTRINRTGDTDAITGRLLDAMRKVYSVAKKRANDPGFLALPVKPSRKRWVPRQKKVGSKRPSARSLNAAVRSAPQTPAPTHVFTVGQLVEILGDESGLTKRGIVKGVRNHARKSQDLITVFWFHDQSTEPISAFALRPIAA